MSETFIGMPGVVSNDSDATVHTGGWRTTVTIPEDTLRWGPTFPQGAHRTLANTQMRRNLGHATRTIRTKRGQRVAEMPDWEDLRDAAEAIKFEVESRLPELPPSVCKNLHYDVLQNAIQTQIYKRCRPRTHSEINKHERHHKAVILKLYLPSSEYKRRYSSRCEA